MGSRRRTALLALLALLAIGAAEPDTPLPAWQSRFGRDHPLVGRIWDAGGAAFVEPATLVRRTALARYVLLGERHDNADHHRLQAWVLRQLVAAGRRPAVAFEMLMPEQTPALARHLARSPRDAAGIGDAVGWAGTGWPPWTTYQPIAEVALDTGLQIAAAGLPAATREAMRREGVAALDPAFAGRYALDRPLRAEIAASMTAEIRESHCGHAPAAMVSRMIEMQRATDARMADTLLTAGGDGGVLIAGAGHVRTDWAVPVSLRLREAGPVVAVAFIEVEDAARAPGEYAARLGAERLPFDYVWFTPRVDDEDPCEKYRKSLERLRDRR